MQLATTFMTGLSSTAAFVLVAAFATVSVGIITRAARRHSQTVALQRHEQEMSKIEANRMIQLNSRELVSHSRSRGE